MTIKTKADSFLESHLEEHITELSLLCAQPSVSTINLGLTDCAALVEKMLKKRGFFNKINSYCWRSGCIR